MNRRLKVSITSAVIAQEKKTRWHKVVSGLAAVVVFCTTYALILPAITMERETICGLQEHTHTEQCYQVQKPRDAPTHICTRDSLGVHEHIASCYNNDGTLICGYADFIIHTHDAYCYDADGQLVCDLPEIEAHVHNDSCFAEENVLVCQTDESAGHTHSEDCYTQTRGDLTCTLPEDENHHHDDSCYTWENELNCVIEEAEAGHGHSDSCYEIKQTLVCGRAEIIPHIHEAECFDSLGNIVCGITETLTHQHSEDCFAQIANSSEIITLICGMDEHTHSEGCFANSTEPEADKESVLNAITPDGVLITMKGLTSAYPAPIEELSLTADEVTSLTDVFESALLETGAIPLEMRLFDIRLWHNGEEVQPIGEISITFTGIALNNSNADIEVYHFNEASVTTTSMESEVLDDGSIVTITDHFSVYGVAAVMDAAAYAATGVTSYAAAVYAPNYIGAINTANEWQTVSQQYGGNTQSYKIPYDGDGDGKADVYLQKNVVPTGTENEFLVYLSMDKKMTFETFLDESKFWLTTSNGLKGKLGQIVSSFGGNKTEIFDAYTTSGSREYPVYVSVYQNASSTTPIYSYYDIRRGSSPNCSNGTMLMEMPSVSGYLVVQVSVSLGGPNGQTIEARINLDTVLADFATYNTVFDSVVDEMGENITFLGVENCDGTWTHNNGTLTWVPVDNPDVVSAITTNPLGGWENNISQLVYRVRLEVGNEGFYSCANNMNSKQSDPESNRVNQSATLTYHKEPLPGVQQPIDTASRTADFPVPYVRGLLYNIDLIKLDENGRLLQNAEFTVYDRSGAPVDVLSTDENGYLKFTDLPWGTYRLVETGAPLGYAGTTFEQNVTLCYTTDSGKLRQDTQMPANMIYVENGKPIEILNNTNQGYLSLSKVVDSNVPGAENVEFEFQITFSYGGRTLAGEYAAVINPGGENATIAIDSDGMAIVHLKHGQTITIPGLPTGTEYSISETAEEYIITSTGFKGTIQQNVTATSTFTNKRYDGTLKIHKTDRNGVAIENTEFTLYKAAVDELGSWAEITPETPYAVSTTDANGDVAFTPLQTGNYLLYETVSAPGFDCPADPWKVSVDDNGIVAVTAPDGTILSTEEGAYNIVNHSVVVLPNTGGSGTLPYTLTGIALILVTGLVYTTMKLRRGGHKAT